MIRDKSLNARNMFRVFFIPAIVLIPAILHAAGGAVTSPTSTAPDRYVYYPGTEALSKDEIRVTACGTGLPAARRGQAATCFLIELGNGDKFLFDIGTGSMANIAAMMIPYEYLDKVFLSHLHTDHMGDPQRIEGVGSIWRHPGNGDGICHGALSQIRELGQGHARVQDYPGTGTSGCP
jgi:hypothetical protein